MLILTPNRRLAAFSQNLYDQENIDQGKQCWQTAAIYPFASWLQELWAGRPILNKMQQQILLEQIIQQSNVGVELLRIGPTAKNVLQAWEFLSSWQIKLSRLESYAQFSTNTAVFCSWIKDYLSWLKQNDYIDFQLMVDELMLELPSIKSKLPSEICLRGMTNLSPQYTAFIEQLKNLGVKLKFDQIIKPGATSIRTSFVDSNAELQAAANWALFNLTTNPQHAIGIVVPDLEAKRQQVSNIFNATIPQSLLNISAPLGLESYPLINVALLLLQMSREQINYADFSIILRCPYIHAAEEEQNLRACLDRKLRQQVEAKLSWNTIQELLINVDTQLKDVLSKLINKISANHGYQSADFWVKYFEELLAVWGWPGDRGFTVEESDLYSCWHELLDEYTKLSMIIKEQNFSQALQTLQNLANQTPFLPAETGVSRVHVLGLLEAEGLMFDQLWVSGMSLDSWPPEANPNPFIPLEIQKQFDLPRSSAQRELKVAQNLTQNLQNGAKEQVIFSYPQSIDDYKAEPSNLIINLPEEPILVAKQTIDTNNFELELFFDAVSSEVARNENDGGTNILKLQAQCPFKAHAEIRMQALSLVEPQLFLSKAQRGIIIHDVLEKFWRECKSQDQLISWFPETAVEILQQIIHKILAVWKINYPNTLTNDYINLEANAVLALVLRWLEYELTRPKFTIKELEKKRQIKIGPLNISGRIDRIDSLADGSEVIIDYKTGANKVSDWTADPIVEPQLPLYAISSPDNISGIYYASLTNDEMKLKGISLPDFDVPEMIAKWRNSLQQTALGFATGNAAVDPYSPQICEKCSLQALCRIYDC